MNNKQQELQDWKACPPDTNADVLVHWLDRNGQHRYAVAFYDEGDWLRDDAEPLNPNIKVTPDFYRAIPEWR